MDTIETGNGRNDRNDLPIISAPYLCSMNEPEFPKIHSISPAPNLFLLNLLPLPVQVPLLSY